LGVVEDFLSLWERERDTREEEGETCVAGRVEVGGCSITGGPVVAGCGVDM
jgi:hypothetical protein